MKNVKTIVFIFLLAAAAFIGGSKTIKAEQIKNLKIREIQYQNRHNKICNYYYPRPYVYPYVYKVEIIDYCKWPFYYFSQNNTAAHKIQLPSMAELVAKSKR